jgi:PAS domain S-box-containing protein
MRQAKDLMTHNPKYIQSGEELRSAVSFFLQNDVRFAPVITPLGEIIGLLSEFSLVKASLRHYLDPEKHEKIIHHKDILEEVFFVEEEDSLDTVIKVLIKSPSHRIVVLSKQKKLMGIISPKDILRFITGESKKSIDLRTELETTKKQAEKLSIQLSSLQENLKKFQSLYNETPYMMHSVDAHGTIILANKKIHQVLGYREGELIGKSLTDLYPQTVHHEAMYGLRRIMDSGYHHTVYTTFVTKDGQKIRVDIASSSLKDQDGNFMGTISISREIDSEHLLRALHGVVSKHVELPSELVEDLRADAFTKKIGND